MSWSWANIDWEKTLTAAVGISALVQGLVAAVMMRGLRHARAQAEAAQETLNLARQSNEVSLRAYIEVEQIEVTVGEGQDLEAVLELKNYGATPARNLQLHWAVFIAPRAERETYKPDLSAGTPEWFSNASLGKDTSVRSAQWVKASEAQAALEPVFKGASLLMALGKATYEDVFGIERETIFRRVLENPKLSRMAACNTGNRST